MKKIKESLLYVNFVESLLLLKTSFKILLKGKIPSRHPTVFANMLYSENSINNDAYQIQSNTTNRKEIMREIVNLGIIRDGVSVLDVGCGCGLLVDIIDEFGLQVDYTGIDVSSYMLREVKNKEMKPNRKFLLGDFHKMNISLENKQFDVVVCLAINRFIKEYDVFFDQLAMVTSPTGIILFRVLKNNLFERLRVLFYRVFSLGTFKGELSFYESLKSIVEKKGFNIELLLQNSKKKPFEKGVLGIVKLFKNKEGG